MKMSAMVKTYYSWVKSCGYRYMNKLALDVLCVSFFQFLPGLPDFIKGHGSLLDRCWLSESMHFVSDGVKTVLAYSRNI